MLVTATQFKGNIGKYLALVSNEDIYITKNGKNIARLTSTQQNKIDIARSLFGITPNDGTTLEQYREERITNKNENSD